MTILSTAQTVLGIASAAVPHVTRTFLAGGPEFAKTCTQLAVYPGPTTVEGQSAAGTMSPELANTCASLAVPAVIVAYSKDCWPMVEGRKVPDPADMTAWTTEWMTDCWAIIDALLEAKYDGGLGPCDSVIITAAQHTGPTSGVATMLLPVAVRP